MIGLIYDIKNWFSTNPSYHNVTRAISDDGTNYENSEIAAFVYSPNFLIAESVVGEFKTNNGTKLQ